MRHLKTFAGLGVMLALAIRPAYAQQQRSDAPAVVPAAPSTMMPGGYAMPGMNAGSMPMTRMMHMMGQEGMGGMRVMAATTEHVEGRLAFLKTELKITDVQLPLWNAFADTARENAKAMKELMRSGGLAATSQPTTLPDKLARWEKMTTTRVEALRKLRAAVDPLYAALSTEQKKIADTLVLGPMGIMM
jgi:hypothetical protein